MLNTSRAAAGSGHDGSGDGAPPPMLGHDETVVADVALPSPAGDQSGPAVPRIPPPMLGYDEMVVADVALPSPVGDQSGLAVPRRPGRPRKAAAPCRKAAVAGKRKADLARSVASKRPVGERREPVCFGCELPKTEMEGNVGQLEVDPGCRCTTLWCFGCTLKAVVVAQVTGVHPPLARISRPLAPRRPGA